MARSWCDVWGTGRSTEERPSSLWRCSNATPARRGGGGKTPAPGPPPRPHARPRGAGGAPGGTPRGGRHPTRRGGGALPPGSTRGAGRVLPAAHMVQAVAQVAVDLADGQRVPARVLASVTSADVALLQLDVVPPGLAPAHLGDSDTVEVGDDVFVVGAPYSLSRTLTVGHVSGRQVAPSSLAPMAAREFFLTDAAVNPGNSGSPLFNRQGDVIGIVSSILSRSGGFEGLGVAATATMARRLLLERKPFWSGMEGILIQGDLAGVLNLPQPAGFVVQRVAAGSLGGRLGIRPGAFH